MYNNGKQNFECWYCGHGWSDYPSWNAESLKCPKCGDKNAQVVSEMKKIDTYVGAPPFSKEDDDSDNKGDWGR